MTSCLSLLFSRYWTRSINTHAAWTGTRTKFDVKELADSFELHGELPSIDQKDVDIELTDASTLTIKGCVEHSYSKGCPQAGFVEGETGKVAIWRRRIRDDKTGQ
ncbi:unnamed protein product [Blumeria hordei]|uniref:Uncharacterized protein n=1 Tax=Blumeria hordei TaxID=2867405 RepID=A0A383UN62_BLUHO|nr:unnamed protein product [Blumeria hordei]